MTLAVDGYPCAWPAGTIPNVWRQRFMPARPCEDEDGTHYLELEDGTRIAEPA